MGADVAVVDRESPLRKFDESTLKGIGSRELDAAAPRAMFLPSNMGEAMELAKLMAAGNFVPPHLRGKPGDCLAVVMQATRWALDPFAVGNKTYFVNDRMAYEAQLVNAVINSAHVLDGRLHPSWEGEGNELVCTITGKLKDDPEPKVRRVAIKTITTRNSPLWKQDPEQQLAYFAMRAWVRLHAPEVLLGVYTPDELAPERVTQDGGEIAARPLTGEMLLEQSKPTDSPIEQSAAEYLGDEIPRFEGDEEADGTVQPDPASEIAGTTEQRPDDADPGEPEDIISPAEQFLMTLRESIEAAEDKAALKAVDERWTKNRAAYDDAVAARIDKLITARRKALATEAGK